ncbi:PP2C family protein-serine/threonine phosphatase [Microbacterium stercoris]|uniref:SpoIIE family protein phosphatase n=1 Tax=Microbacterium stercoris TaxID=2820289 RepID=A0A939TYL0_9MICO|nr:SpoIIE family protein phosphatase [Microbacterium stercoris]MBO3664817.1 SpoIIE family protein phosphatase [Microbacterium stercoris]
MSATPAEETARQGALDALELVDRPRDERVERITRLAQELFDVPMVSVNLVDRDRLWSLSEVGFGRREAPRTNAFCDVAVRQQGTLVVENAEVDPQFAASPFVTGNPGIRFYAGQPLQAPGGENIGTLCILDTKPRSLSDRQRALLEELAAWVQKEITRDVEVALAAVVQRAFAPHEIPSIPGYTIAAQSTPAGELSGDFYDLYLHEGRLRVTLADVMGKGTGPALVAATARAALRTAPERSLVASIEELDRLLDRDLRDLDMFVTAFHAELDPASGAVTYVDSGHSLAFLFRRDGSWEQLRMPGLPLGMGFWESRTEATAHLGPGDALVCCSDGLLDVLDTDDPFGDVAAALRQHGPRGAVEEAMRRASSTRAHDDVTVIAITRDQA